MAAIRGVDENAPSVVAHIAGTKVSKNFTERVMLLPVSMIDGKRVVAFRIPHEEGCAPKLSFFGDKFGNLNANRRDDEYLSELGVAALQNDTHYWRIPEEIKKFVWCQMSDSSAFTLNNLKKADLNIPATQWFLTFRVPIKAMSEVRPRLGEQIV